MGDFLTEYKWTKKLDRNLKLQVGTNENFINHMFYPLGPCRLCHYKLTMESTTLLVCTKLSQFCTSCQLTFHQLHYLTVDYTSMSRYGIKTNTTSDMIVTAAVCAFLSNFMLLRTPIRTLLILGSWRWSSFSIRR